MELLKLITPRYTRYYIDGKQVTHAKWKEAKEGKTLFAFLTTQHEQTTRHYCQAH